MNNAFKFSVRKKKLPFAEKQTGLECKIQNQALIAKSVIIF